MSDYINETDIAQVATKNRLVLDTIRILVQTQTCEVTTLKRQVDDNGDTVSQSQGPNFIYRDKPATENDPEDNSYTEFMTKLGLTKTKVRSAVKQMESM